MPSRLTNLATMGRSMLTIAHILPHIHTLYIHCTLHVLYVILQFGCMYCYDTRCTFYMYMYMYMYMHRRIIIVHVHVQCTYNTQGRFWEEESSCGITQEEIISLSTL